MDTEQIKQQIEANPFYQQILSDSFGGVMYNVANRNKYDEGKEILLALYEQVKDSGVNGIMKGAMNFIQGN